MQENNKQPRTKSPLFWLGLLSAGYAAFLGGAASSGAELPWYVGALGTAFAAISAYAVANNPSDKNNF